MFAWWKLQVSTMPPATTVIPYSQWRSLKWSVVALHGSLPMAISALNGLLMMVIMIWHIFFFFSLEHGKGRRKIFFSTKLNSIGHMALLWSQESTTLAAKWRHPAETRAPYITMGTGVTTFTATPPTPLHDEGRVWGGMPWRSRLKSILASSLQFILKTNWQGILLYLHIKINHEGFE